MTKDLARWIVTFCAVFGLRVPRTLLPQSWTPVLDQAENEERELERRLRTPIETDKIPEFLQENIERALRAQNPPDPVTPFRLPALTIAAAAVIALTASGFWIHGILSPAPIASHSGTAPAEAVQPPVEPRVALQQPIPPLPVNWEGMLWEEKERIAADGLNAIRFVAANFVPDPFMDEVDDQIARWEARVIAQNR